MTSLYIHIPFCRKKCFYCAFPVAVAGKRAVGAYLDCLKQETLFCAKEKVSTLYVGGGTPTSLTDGQFSAMLKSIKSVFCCLPDYEFTVEVNPEDIDCQKAKYLFDCGVNRISLGVQSFNSKYLTLLGRGHNARDAFGAFENLRKAGFRNINLDFMYGFPRQTTRELGRDLDEMMTLGAEHISCYSLEVERNSLFYQKGVPLQKDSTQARFYEYVRSFLEEAGFRQYEISNFSKKGRESAHNLNYWQGGNYIGLGLGAHSHKNGRRFWNVGRLREYISRIESGQSSEDGHEQLTAFQRLTEKFLFGLRMNQGVDIKAIEKEFQCRLSDEQQQKVKLFVDTGWLLDNKNIIQATPKGRLVLDELSVQLIADR